MGSEVLACEGVSNLKEDVVLLVGDLNSFKVFRDERDSLVP